MPIPYSLIYEEEKNVRLILRVRIFRDIPHSGRVYHSVPCRVSFVRALGEKREGQITSVKNTRSEALLLFHNVSWQFYQTRYM